MPYQKPRYPHWPPGMEYNPFCSCDDCHITFLMDDCEYVPGSDDPMEQDTTAEIIKVMWDYVLS